MEKVIELTPLAEIGKGSARITNDSVELEISGICGTMKAWLVGGEAVPIGNIVDGKLRRQIDTKSHNGILVTQSGRQMLIGKYAEEQPAQNADSAAQAPFSLPGFAWKKTTRKDYSQLSGELRYIMSNTSIYRNYRKYGHYWVGESSGGSAVALRWDEKEENPLGFLGKMKFTHNGYIVVCVDKETKKLYIP